MIACEPKSAIGRHMSVPDYSQPKWIVRAASASRLGTNNRVSSAVSTRSGGFEKSLFYSIIRTCSIPARAPAFAASRSLRLARYAQFSPSEAVKAARRSLLAKPGAAITPPCSPPPPARATAPTLTSLDRCWMNGQRTAIGSAGQSLAGRGSCLIMASDNNRSF